MNKRKERNKSLLQHPKRGKKKSRTQSLSPMQYADSKSRREGLTLTAPYLPEMKVGKYEIVHTDQSGKTLDIVTLRMELFASISASKIEISFPWSVMTLLEDGQLIRSTAPTESFHLLYTADNAHGDVLIGGLGIGLVLHLLEANTKITSITCVENELELIDMLSPYFPDVTFVHDELENYFGDIANTEKYDFVFLDAGGDSEGTFYSKVVPWRIEARMILKPTSGPKDLVCWSEEVMRGQIIHSILREIHEGLDLTKMSAEEIAHRKNYQRVDMDFFERYGKLEPSDATTALVRKFVKEWEYRASK